MAIPLAIKNTNPICSIFNEHSNLFLRRMNQEQSSKVNLKI